MLQEFKEFAVKGNVLDMAVGIIIGAAFGKIVTSLVEDVIMPPIGLVLGKVDFTNFYINISLEAAKAAGAPMIRYGVFLNQTISFVIVAFAVFLLVEGRQPPAEAGRDRRGSHREALSILHDTHPTWRHSLPALHLAVGRLLSVLGIADSRLCAREHGAMGRKLCPSQP